ncbi:hypothetical protein EOM81_02270 [bacterium]|nr:hypothetical protein [bacterium]
MTSLAFKKKIMIQEAVGATSLNESYLVTDAETGCGMAVVEEHVTIAQKVAKMFIDKSLLPTSLTLKNCDGDKILDLYQPASFFRSAFTVRDANGKILCVFKQAFSLIKPLIYVEDEKGQIIGHIKSDWRFRNFVFTSGSGETISAIKHKFMGIAKHLLTSADDYEVEMSNTDENMLLISIAAAICIDFFYHEN